MPKKKFNFPGKKTPKINTPEIEVEVDDTYEAYDKGSIPAAGQYQVGSETLTITWFNNFGVRLKGASDDSNVEYTVKLKKLPAGQRLFVLDNTTALEVTEKKPSDPDDKDLKYSDAGNGNIKFKWNKGDPPTGSAP